MSTLEKAIEIATEAHKGQFDKAGKPYIEHPLAVAALLETEDEKTVAVLHDVLEDTPVTIEDLRRAGFSEEILRAVYAVTRKIRQGKKETYFGFIHRIKHSGELAVRVKLADLAHNSLPERIAVLPPDHQGIVFRYEKATKILKGEMV